MASCPNKILLRAAENGRVCSKPPKECCFRAPVVVGGRVAGGVPDVIRQGRQSLRSRRHVGGPRLHRERLRPGVCARATSTDLGEPATQDLGSSLEVCTPAKSNLLWHK